MRRRRFLAAVAGFLVGWRMLPVSAAGKVVSCWIVIRPYKPPTPIPCGGVAPGRVLCEVWVSASGATVAPVTVEFGQVAGSRTGSDKYVWIEEVRTVAIPSGSSRVALVDQIRPAAGEFYFQARAGDQVSERCSFIWI